MDIFWQHFNQVLISWSLFRGCSWNCSHGKVFRNDSLLPEKKLPKKFFMGFRSIAPQFIFLIYDLILPLVIAG